MTVENEKFPPPPMPGPNPIRISQETADQIKKERVHEPTCSWLMYGPCDGDQCYWAVRDEDGKYRRV